MKNTCVCARAQAEREESSCVSCINMVQGGRGASHMSEHTGHPWGCLLNSSQADATGAHEECPGIATNGEEPPNQEILLQRFQSNSILWQRVGPFSCSKIHL